MYSHKFNGPGLAYELAMSIFEPKLVWLKGPMKPGEVGNDLAVYKSEIKQKIPAAKKIVVDSVYKDKKDPRLARKNAHDPEDLRRFKARASARQEAFHSRIKRFACLQNPFRHSMDRHGTCFVAICVICQYEMDLVTPAFDV